MPDVNIDPEKIDAEMRKFIDDYLSVSNHLSTADSIQQQRQCYDKICRHFSYPDPASVEFEDSYIDGRHGNIGLRQYRNLHAKRSEIQLLFLHGGGFILGSLDSHHDICAEICATTGFDIISVDYRLSPEYHHPVHLDDVEDSILTFDITNIIVVGISAGACLSAALSHRLKTNGLAKLRGQLLIYPGLGGDRFNLPSYQENADAPLLTTDDVLFYRKVRCKSEQLPQHDPEFYPLAATDFKGLPPTVAISADVDPLRDDSARYIEETNKAGANNRWINLPGLTHDFVRARHLSAKARAGFETIIDSIEKIASGSLTKFEEP